VRVVALGSAAAISAAALLAASGWLVTRAAEQPPVLALLAAIVVVRAVGLVRAFARYGERIAGHDVAFKKLATIRVRWYRRLIASSTELPAADLLSRFVIDVDELQHRDLRVRWPAAVALVSALATAGLATAIHPPAGLFLATGLAVAATIVPALAYRAARRQLRRQSQARAKLVDELVEALDSATELALAGRTQERLDRLDRASQDLKTIADRDAAAAAIAQGLGTLVAGATVIAVLLVSTQLEPVWLGALALLTLGAFEATAALPEAAVRAVGVKAAERRLNQGWVRNDKPGLSKRTHPHLRATNLRHRPGQDGPLVLDGVDLTIEPGERVALIGASGAGKTVLANLLAGQSNPDEGEIEHAQTRLAGQDAHLFATSIANNVRIGAPQATDHQIEAALRKTGLETWLDELPDGIDTLVGEQGFAVSGGQRQRIALARCLISPATHLILDEPTAMLDPPAARAFLHDLDTAAGDRAVLVITHQHDHLQAFDRVLTLKDGRLHEQTPV
jgi:thiol reductant ABC exporter CydC subunit